MNRGVILNSQAFEMNLTVQPADIDGLGHVNNLVYLRWVQDIAVAHWRSAASAEDQAKYYWVVLRHEIDYKRSAKPGEAIQVRTWVGTASRIKFERHTEIKRAEDGVLLAKALTVWCPMDRETGRPTAVSPQVRAAFSVGEG